MPQMAPISWLALFFLFSLIFLLFNVVNYFSSIPTPLIRPLAHKLHLKSMSWKW